MAEIRLSRIKSSAFKISSYAGPSVLWARSHLESLNKNGFRTHSPDTTSIECRRTSKKNIANENTWCGLYWQWDLPTVS